MRRARSARLAAALTLIALFEITVGLALLALSWDAQTPSIWAFRGFPYFIGLPFAIIGHRIAARVPGNPIGWLALASAIAAGMQGIAIDYATLALYTGRDLVGGEIAAWVNSWIWVIGMGNFMLVAFVFPDGRFLARGWRAGPAVGLIGVGLVAVGAACAPSLDAAFGMPNPFSCGPLDSAALGILGAGLALFGGALVAGALSLVFRYRGAGRELRLQLKWVAASGLLVGIAFAIQVLDIQDKPRQYLVAASALTLPAAFGVAILRYRLYDIDTIINRAIVYGLLTATLGGGFVAAQNVVPRLLTATIGLSSELVTVALVFAVAAVFTPLRLRLQKAVDRRFKPEREAGEAASGEAVTAGLRSLARLRDEGLITATDYEEKKRDLLARI